MRKQITNETLKIIGPNVVIRKVKIQTQAMPLGRDSNRRYGREPIVSIPTVKDRRLTRRCPRATDQRLEHKATLVRKDDATSGFICVFLYVASLCFANLRWLVRCVPSPVVRASGKSSPSLSRFARSARDDNGHRSSYGSPRLFATASREQCDSREQPALFSADGSTVDVLPVRALAVDPALACFSELSCRHACRHPATSLPSRYERPRFWPLRRCHGRPSTTQWHGNDAVPVLVLFLWVSCAVLSEYRALLLYFFKEQ